MQQPWCQKSSYESREVREVLSSQTESDTSLVGAFRHCILRLCCTSGPGGTFARSTSPMESRLGKLRSLQENAQIKGKSMQAFCSPSLTLIPVIA